MAMAETTQNEAYQALTIALSKSPNALDEYTREVARLIALSGAAVKVGVSNTGFSDVTAEISNIFNQGGIWFFDRGNYLIAPTLSANAGGVLARPVKDLWVFCHPEARFFTSAPGVDNDLILFRASEETDSKVQIVWIGGIIDQRQQKNSTSVPFQGLYPPPNVGASQTCDGLSFRGEKTDGQDVKYNGFSIVRIVGTTFNSGPHWQVAGGERLGVARDRVAFNVPSKLRAYTTVARDALTPEQGDMILNTTTNSFQGYNGVTWVDLG